jgi:hypothetical protein
MLSYVVNEGRLFALKPSEWSMLLVGGAQRRIRRTVHD